MGKMIKRMDKKLLIIILALLIALIGLLGYHTFWDFIVELITIIRHGNQDELQAFLAAQSQFAGYLALFLMCILQVISVVLPGMLFQVSGALIFGWWKSFLICWAGFVSGNALVFSAARLFGKSLMEALSIDKQEGWLAEKMNSANPQFVTALACMIPGVPYGIIPYIAQRSCMNVKQYAQAVAASSWINILLNCIAGHFLVRGQYLFTVMSFVLQIVIIIIVAINKDKILKPENKK